MTDEQTSLGLYVGAGAGIDRFGGPAINPTKNVLDVVRSLDRYHTDMRKQVEYYQALLVDAEKLWVDDLATLRKGYDARLAEDLPVNVKTTSNQLAGRLVKETASLANQITTSFTAQVATLTTAVTGQITSLTAALTPRIETRKSNQASLIPIGELTLSLIILDHLSAPAISVTQTSAQGPVGPR